jgi:hypothetical protein
MAQSYPQGVCGLCLLSVALNANVGFGCSFRRRLKLRAKRLQLWILNRAI